MDNVQKAIKPLTKLQGGKNAHTEPPSEGSSICTKCTGHCLSAIDAIVKYLQVKTELDENKKAYVEHINSIIGLIKEITAENKKGKDDGADESEGAAVEDAAEGPAAESY